MWSLFVPAALAASHFASVGPDTALAVGGLWARAVPADDGWTFFWAAGGGYLRAPLSADLVLDERAKVELTGHTDLMDHRLVQCPDGTWLHHASAQRNAPGDTAFVFRYDADWGRIGEAVIVDTSTDIHTNDMAAVCDPAVGALVAYTGDRGTQHIFRVADDLSSQEISTTSAVPQLMGGSLVWEPEHGTLIGMGRAYGRPLQGARMDADAQPTGDIVDLALAAEGEDAYWPQAVVRVGDLYVVAYMWRVDDGSFKVDEGQVRLAVFDLDWEVLETVQLTDYVAPDGGMRPGLALDGDLLLVSWDVDSVPHVALVTLADDGDTGTVDTGGGDTGDSGDDSGGVTGDSGDSGVDSGGDSAADSGGDSAGGPGDTGGQEDAGGG